MKQLFTADLHLGHQKVAGLRGFDDWLHHDATIANNWRSAVDPKDTVWILGDFSCGREGHALRMLRSLPGKKRLILGNHDDAHPMHRHASQAMARYGDVFEYVAMAGRVKLAGRDVLLSHFPYMDDHDSEVRYSQWRLMYKGMPLLHGHTHNPDQSVHNWGQDVNPGMGPAFATAPEIHVGLDAWGLRPVPGHVLEQLLQENEQ